MDNNSSYPKGDIKERSLCLRKVPRDTSSVAEDLRALCLAQNSARGEKQQEQEQEERPRPSEVYLPEEIAETSSNEVLEESGDQTPKAADFADFDAHYADLLQGNSPAKVKEKRICRTPDSARSGKFSRQGRARQLKDVPRLWRDLKLLSEACEQLPTESQPQPLPASWKPQELTLLQKPAFGQSGSKESQASDGSKKGSAEPTSPKTPMAQRSPKPRSGSTNASSTSGGRPRNLSPVQRPMNLISGFGTPSQTPRAAARKAPIPTPLSSPVSAPQESRQKRQSVIAESQTTTDRGARKGSKEESVGKKAAEGNNKNSPPEDPSTEPKKKEKRASLVGMEANIDKEANNKEKVIYRMAKLASQLRVPLDVLQQVWEVFEEVCTPVIKSNAKDPQKVIDVFQDAELNHERFAKVLCKLTGVEDPESLPDGLMYRSFTDADQNRNQSIGFLEFALWYSRHGFLENILLTDEQRQVRSTARKFGMPVTEVEQYKRKFDLFDEDRSGVIEFSEFKKLLGIVVKVPGNLQLPEARIRQFWQESDVDNNGAICFEEFLLFYKRYFNPADPSACPFEEYYRGIRRVPVRRVH
eukprot:TRINITY_DN4533_c0_g1_i1.p1 TRINITY_DN4533_c0_g1~~TRINITY_DN4533_c0_g1_i1.p1  ORF type:complete len:585 (+),score=126.75 TRINITY_DN4533_c0_g1_i1:91-1845(+)